jgi:hypothetical protein
VHVTRLPARVLESSSLKVEQCVLLSELQAPSWAALRLVTLGDLGDLVVHAAMCVCMCVCPCAAADRSGWLASWRVELVTGLVVCFGACFGEGRVTLLHVVCSGVV